ncbi:hypothetical protein GCM10011348_37520 [Marinobacterium nitratireducens]|uniref:DUF2489 domain-containing protein n=1 Tax=Marinobacterium nitratireducens TaxID=518897 RepID=A0A917ZME0_9GAMM|nr:DUF2489 domain-containing protein [Marinobacterium nitratireducens]GGO86518.1 hypothetical protein GCM10011348_37520 [Marinobacterium nitratireducens]
MSDAVLYGLSGLGLLVIVALLVYIVRQLGVLKRQRQQQEHERRQLEETQKKAREQRAYLIDSIRVIARAMSEDERLTLTEGCIRLKVLLDNLKPEMHRDPDFEIIEQHYLATRHIPYLEAWRKLERREQRRYQREMDTLEAQNRTALLQAADKLSRYPLERMH